MSVRVNVSDLTCEERENIYNDLTVITGTTPGFGGDARMVCPFHVDERHNASIPLHYAVNKLGAKRLPRSFYDRVDVPFQGALRQPQDDLKKQVLKIMGDTSTAIVSAYTGFGKCLGVNTPVIMYSGEVKKVQNVIPGDILMGDDSTPRNVINTCVGEEQLFRISPEENSGGDSFVCNASHIISVVTPKHEIIDIPIRDFILLPVGIQEKLRLFRVAIDFPPQELDDDPYVFGYNLLQTTSLHNTGINRVYIANTKECRLKLLAGVIDSFGVYNKHDNQYEIIFQKHTKVISDLCFVIRSLGMRFHVANTSAAKSKKLFTLYITGSDIVTIPVNATMKKAYKEHDGERACVLAGTNIKYYPMNFKVSKENSKDNKYYGFSIDGNHRFLLGDFTVTHNTITSISLFTSCKLKTLVIAHRLVLINQWRDAFERFCPDARVTILDTKTVPDPANTDVWIVNAENILKFDVRVFSRVGFVICDEVHVLVAENVSRVLQHLFPRYLLGLSATPYREDGMNKLFDIYFGEDRIVRAMNHKHIVYKVNTGIKPPMAKGKTGRIDWNSIISAQATNPERNMLTVKILSEFSTRKFLVLVKRIAHGKELVKLLDAHGESVTSMLGTQKKFDKDARILVGTTSKLGVGFDHPDLDALCLAADVEAYFIQYLGRVFRKQDTTPIIIDMVDNNPILEKHFKTRKQTYEGVGGIVKTYYTS